MGETARAATRHPFEDPTVEAMFASFPAPERAGLLALRDLIFDTAAKDPSIGPLHETLKWNQPAYLTPKTKSGSTIRLGLPKGGGFALFTHCQTTILSEFQTAFGSDFRFEGNRAVLFDAGDPLPLDKLEMLVRRALTYRQRPR